MNRFQSVLLLLVSLLLVSLPQVASHAAISPQAVRVFVDGRLIKLNPAAFIACARRILRKCILTVSLQRPASLSINVVAIDGAGVESEPVTVLVRQG